MSLAELNQENNSTAYLIVKRAHLFLLVITALPGVFLTIDRFLSSLLGRDLNGYLKAHDAYLKYIENYVVTDFLLIYMLPILLILWLAKSGLGTGGYSRHNYIRIFSSIGIAVLTVYLVLITAPGCSCTCDCRSSNDWDMYVDLFQSYSKGSF